MGPSSKTFFDLAALVATTPLVEAEVPTRAPSRAFRFSAAQRQAVVESYETGASMASLARQYDVRREAISKLLRRSGVEIRTQRAMRQEEIDEAERLYVDGWSLQKIATRLGWEDTTIYNQLKRRGVQMRGPRDRQL